MALSAGVLNSKEFSKWMVSMSLRAVESACGWMYVKTVAHVALVMLTSPLVSLLICWRADVVG